MMPLFDLPWSIWGLICLCMAGVWSLSWPKERAGAPGTRRFFIIRWFHALTWLMLAGAAFSVDQPSLFRLAPLLALVGLGFYLVFLTTLTLRR